MTGKTKRMKKNCNGECSEVGNPAPQVGTIPF